MDQVLNIQFIGILSTITKLTHTRRSRRKIACNGNFANRCKTRRTWEAGELHFRSRLHSLNWVCQFQAVGYCSAATFVYQLPCCCTSGKSAIANICTPKIVSCLQAWIWQGAWQRWSPGSYLNCDEQLFNPLRMFSGVAVSTSRCLGISSHVKSMISRIYI